MCIYLARTLSVLKYGEPCLEFDICAYDEGECIAGVCDCRQNYTYRSPSEGCVHEDLKAFHDTCELDIECYSAIPGRIIAKPFFFCKITNILIYLLDIYDFWLI